MILLKVEKIEGIIIGEQLYGESSKILKIFTKKYGLISVISKGCRRPKSQLRIASSTLVYANFDMNYKENKISILLGADILDLFKNIILDYSDLTKKTYVFVILSLTVQVINQKGITQEEIVSIYDICINSIKKIDEGFDPFVIFDIVRLKFLEFLGVKPSLDCCSNCGECNNIVTFSSSCYGFICSSCYNNEPLVSKSSIKMLRMLYYVDIEKIRKLELTKEEKEEIDEFLNVYYEEHTGVYLNIKDKLKVISKLNGVL